MSLRRRLVLLCALAVAIAVAAVAIGSYIAVRGELRGQIDELLEAQAATLDEIASRRGPFEFPLDDLPNGVEPPLQPPDGNVGAAQLIATDGSVTSSSGTDGPRLPVSDADLEIARLGGSRLVDVDVGTEPYRVITAGTNDGGAIQIGRSLVGVEGVLSDLRLVLAIFVVVGIAIAGGLAWLVSRRIIAPITRLRETAEHVSQTEDLSRRIPTPGDDELGRLASRFNSMLETIERSQRALGESVTAQRQLVADASHELRTPVASLRTDIESLLDHPELTDAERQATLRTADARLVELTDLIADVIELGRGEEQASATEEVRFDTLVLEAVERTRKLFTGRSFELELEPTVVWAEPARLERAVNNLLDNACKYSPADEPIDVTVAEGVLTVRDRGPGIPAAEISNVFDRFYRGRQTRGEAGSGLGLAIVSQVARSGGGEAWVENNPDRGATFSLRPGPPLADSHA